MSPKRGIQHIQSCTGPHTQVSRPNQLTAALLLLPNHQRVHATTASVRTGNVKAERYMKRYLHALAPRSSNSRLQKYQVAYDSARKLYCAIQPCAILHNYRQDVHINRIG